ncbi:MAG: hypothetical protein ACLSFT_11695 [Ruminococcus callidus]
MNFENRIIEFTNGNTTKIIFITILFYDNGSNIPQELISIAHPEKLKDVTKNYVYHRQLSAGLTAAFYLHGTDR